MRQYYLSHLVTSKFHKQIILLFLILFVVIAIFSIKSRIYLIIESFISPPNLYSQDASKINFINQSSRILSSPPVIYIPNNANVDQLEQLLQSQMALRVELYRQVQIDSEKLSKLQKDVLNLQISKLNELQKELEQLEYNGLEISQKLDKNQNSILNFIEISSKIFEHTRMSQLLPKDIKLFDNYKKRGLDLIPNSFLSNYKNPCWKLSGEFYCLPYFFILGTPKSGTTALYDMILQHPDVISTRKEPHWWTRDSNSLEFYIKHIYKEAVKELEHSTKRSTDKSTKIFGDASASTFWQIENRNYPGRPYVPEIIRSILPNAKLIVVLRNPVDRAVSEFGYFIGDTNKISSEYYDKIVDTKINEFNDCIKQYGTDILCSFGKQSSEMRQGTIRLGTGIYSRSLEIWWRLFPKQQLLIIRSEDLRNNPQEIMKQVFSHLNLTFTSEVAKKITHLVANERPSSRRFVPSTATLDKLQLFYEPFNKELSALTNDERFLWK